MFDKPLSERATELLMEATKDTTGIISRLESEEGFCVITNDKLFFERGKDVWQDALVELFVNELIIKVGGSIGAFCVTKSGYDLCYWPNADDESPIVS